MHTESIDNAMELATLPVNPPILDGPKAEDIILPPDASSLIAKTFFMRVQYGLLGNTRRVKGQGDVLNTDADVERLSLSKTLLNSPELDAIRKSDALLRKWLGNMCLPFFDWPGILVLPKGHAQNVNSKLKQHSIERDGLVDAFIAAYPALIEQSQKSLGSLFNPLDYPAVVDLKKFFTFDWQIVSLQTPDALKEIDSEMYQQQLEASQAKIDAAADQIGAVMREKMLEMVSHLQDRLTPGDDGKPKKLHDTAITNLAAFLDNFDLRNVTDDNALAVEVAKARALLSGTSATVLRSSDEWKEKIRKGMENISSTLGTMVEEKAGRKFRAE